MKNTRLSPSIAKIADRLSAYGSAGDLVLMLLGLLLALLLRYSLRGFQSEDYLHYFQPWYETIRAHGWSAMGMQFSNYPPLYLYMLYGVSVLLPRLSATTAIKIPSILGDLICAWYVFKIVRLHYKTSLVPVLAFWSILFAPTVILNGSMWGQIESLFTAPLVACLYLLMKKKNWQACLAFGIAFTIKLQAVYLAPFLLVLLLRKTVPWKYVLIIPAVYIVSVIPAWLTGRTWLDLLTIYTGQVNAFPGLVVNAPSIYVFFGDRLYEFIYPAGLCLCAAVCLLYVAIGCRGGKDPSRTALVFLAFFSVLLMPFFLPKTHERYFYPADVLSIIFAFYFADRFYLAVLMNLVSFFTYQYYLLYDFYPSGRIDVPMPILALVVLGMVVVLARQMILTLPPEERFRVDG